MKDAFQSANEMVQRFMDETGAAYAEEGDKAAFGVHSIFCGDDCTHEDRVRRPA